MGCKVLHLRRSDACLGVPGSTKAGGYGMIMIIC